MTLISDTDVCEWLGVDRSDTLVPQFKLGIKRAMERFIGWEVERASHTRYYPVTERGGEASYWPGEFGGMSNVGGTTQNLFLDHKYVLLTGLSVSEFSGAYAGQYSSTSWDTLTLGDDYALDVIDGNVSRSGMLLRLGSSWPISVGSVKVTYTAGFSTAEFAGDTSAATDYTDASDIRLAAQIACQRIYNENKDNRVDTTSGVPGPFQSESIPGYSYTRSAVGVANTSMVMALPVECQLLLQPYRKYSIAI